MNDVHDPAAGDVHDLAALYAVDALEPAEQVAFEVHLAGCAPCRAELDGYAEVTARLAQAVAQDPPPAVRAAVLGAVHHAGPLPAGPDGTPIGGGAVPTGTGTRPGTGASEAGFRASSTGGPGGDVVSLDAHRRRRHRRLLAAAAAAVLVPGIALGGWGLGVQSEQRQQQLAAQQQDRENRLLAAPDVATHRIEVQGRPATLLVSQEQDTALFVSTDLPDPGPGREYQLWLVRDDVPVPDVHFTGGQVRTWLDGDVADAAAVAMTVEPAGGSTTPTLPVVAATEI